MQPYRSIAKGEYYKKNQSNDTFSLAHTKWNSAFSEFYEINSEKDDSRLSEFHIKEYLSISYIPLPTGVRWSRQPEIVSAGVSVRVEGVLSWDGDNPKLTKYQFEDIVQDITKSIEKELNGQIDNFIKDYPNSPSITIVVNIQGEYPSYLN